LQRGVGTDLSRVLGELNGFARRIGAGAGDDGHALAGGFHRHADQFALLLRIDGRRLAGGADGDEAVGALGDVPFDQAPVRVVVDRPVFMHRGDDRH
jgi:hypothetical protein